MLAGGPPGHKTSLLAGQVELQVHGAACCTAGADESSQ